MESNKKSTSYSVLLEQMCEWVSEERRTILRTQTKSYYKDELNVI